MHHPYEAFGSVETFLRAAVRDPHVIAIKMTLYRIGANSQLIDLLIQAAEAGKQVAVLVELKARFDERNNILWAKRMESHGIHVVYGFADLKTHAKLCLIVRQETDGIQRYVHTSTGNYNPDKAKVYTDLGYFTADSRVVADVSVSSTSPRVRTRRSSARSSSRRRSCERDSPSSSPARRNTRRRAVPRASSPRSTRLPTTR